MYRNENSNNFGGFILGLAFGATLAYFYSQNKEMVDTKIKEALQNSSDLANKNLNNAKKVTSDNIEETGKAVSSFGSRLSKIIDQKAEEIEDKSNELAKNIRKSAK